MQNYHILPTDTGWEFKEEHGDRALLKASTKDAIVHQAAQYLDGKTDSVKIHTVDRYALPRCGHPRCES